MTETYIENTNPEILEVVPTHTEVTDDVIYNTSTDKKVVFYRSYQVIWFLFGVIETLLIFRFVLKFIGASTISGFTDFIYSLSYPFAAPFYGILTTTVSGNSIAEWSTLVAMIVYLVLAYGLVEVIKLLTPIQQPSSNTTVKRTRLAV